MSNRTIEQEVSEAVNYIVRVFKKQGFAVDCNDLYGDGSSWKLIKRSGFETVYRVVLDKYNAETVAV